MSMEYIRRHYGVPAKRGARVCYQDKDGVKWTGRITSAKGAYIMVAVDDRVPGYRRRLKLHPTWHIDYLPADGVGAAPIQQPCMWLDRCGVAWKNWNDAKEAGGEPEPLYRAAGVAPSDGGEHV